MTSGLRMQLTRPWRCLSRTASRFADHDDPLAEASNWVTLTIGTHLPFWPLYVWWCAGRQAWPSALLTVAAAPAFLAVPLLSRRSALASRIAAPLVGLANAVFTLWVLGAPSGTALFFLPCVGLAAMSFRRSERWIMLLLAALPLAVWYGTRGHLPPPPHKYTSAANASLFMLNAVSVGVIFMLFGWLQAGIYQRMEQPAVRPPG